MFRSSLPIGRVLEDPPGLPPVILCYKLNGQWLSGERGGPVRMIVPETGLVRSAAVAMPSGGVANWYRLTVAGYRTVFGSERALPAKAFFEPIKVTLQDQKPDWNPCRWSRQFRHG